VTRAELVAVARGERPADLVLRGGRLANVVSAELLDGLDVAVAGGRIAGVGGPYDAHETLELDGAVLAPALIEAHMHVESTLLTPFEFARVACVRGTGTAITDPHEIANVHGVAGVEWMLDAARGAPVDVLVMASSCVPATDMETAGARLDAPEVARLLEHEHVLGLAEVMDFPGVVAGEPGVMAKLDAAGARPIDGHAPGLSGRALSAYVAAGPGSEHEATTLEEAREKLRAGLYVFLRDATPARDLEALLPLLTPANSRRCAMVSDDVSPSDLLDRGHLDHHLRTAVAAGVDPLIALQMVTLNPAEWFGLRDRGAIVPGRRADLVVLEDLVAFRALHTFQAGVPVAREGRCLREAPVLPPLPASVNVDWGRVDLALPAGGRRRARVIEVVPDAIVTGAGVEDAPLSDGAVVADPERDLAKLAVVERHTGASGSAVALVRGLGLRRGALASSFAHDHHNLVIGGIDDADLRTAGEEVTRLGGGFAAVADGRVLASLPLPLAGLMSPAPAEEVRAGHDAVRAAARELGCTLADPFMTLSFLGLEVIPKLKLTDRGLVDVDRFELVSPLVD
jgi:adenine deaminase